MTFQSVLIDGSSFMVIFYNCSQKLVIGMRLSWTGAPMLHQQEQHLALDTL